MPPLNVTAGCDGDNPCLKSQRAHFIMGGMAGDRIRGTRMRAIRYAIFAPALALLLAATGCETPAPAPVFPDLTFAHLTPIGLDVSTIEVIENYKSPMRAPNVEHEFPVSPGKATLYWAKQRFRATGSVRRGQVIIQDASVTATPLKMKKGVKGLFSDDQSVRYDARIQVRIEVNSPVGGRSSFATATVKRSRTAAEEISVNERHQLFFDLVSALMEDLDAAAIKSVRQHMSEDLR